jgi:hypothetical protein
MKAIRVEWVAHTTRRMPMGNPLVMFEIMAINQSGLIDFYTGVFD